MIAPETIARLEADPDGLDFAALQQAGMTMLQELCGEYWTDYNAHDPGVTMLDQLSYALTDLAYRSSLPHGDYLAAGDGSIDLGRQALHLPQDIFPSAALTADDWRRHLYDSIPHIEDVWLIEDGKDDGLARIRLKLGEPDAAPQVQVEIRKTFTAGRALCQDLERIDVLQTSNFYLKGDIEIHSLRDPADIYADIFFQCQHHVISGLQLIDYDHAAADGMPFDRLFAGPYTEHGLIQESGLCNARERVSVARLIGVIRGIDGVQKVHALELCDSQGNDLAGELENLPADAVPRLCDPEAPLLRLHFMGKTSDETDAVAKTAPAGPDPMAALIERTKDRLKKLKFESRALRERKATLEHFISAPRGAGVALDPYYSIQHQFPAIYGINAYGLPASASAAERASARQLKGYLYVFEQVMANYLCNLAHIRDLFSIDGTLGQSYFSQPVTNRMLPDIERLYTVPVPELAQELERIRERYDPFEDRRDRVLDVMLAMYGERYTQQALRKFNFYFSTRKALQTWLLENKLAFLSRIAGLGKERAAAFRHDQPAWDTDNVSGAQRKVAILLGLHQFPCCRSLTAPLRRLGLRIAAGGAAAASLPALLARLAQQPPPAGMPLLSITQDTLHSACLHGWNSGAAAPTSLSPEQSRQLRELNMACEGLHLLEHTLLRPRDAGRASHPPTPDGFYAFQVSIVFPGWTARFADPEFRKLAQETVSLNLPAHILPAFYWLGDVEMEDFENRYRKWLDALRAQTLDWQQGGAPAGAVVRALDDASAALVRFLRAPHRRPALSLHWI
ncbi:hypothetical protein [Janthinobacterium sp. GW458P]|uniref:hypothetical protein n=1 Tax=Janthinobacterium sp. GW458P TaxID=1981504 RepID=UPI000A3284E7|nr:hypothetical protein [Janthinobacterium sp. GW458P]MBE3024380.1 hypothetical protein [Janthinobacterium sp. GW458P]